MYTIQNPNTGKYISYKITPISVIPKKVDALLNAQNYWSTKTLNKRIQKIKKIKEQITKYKDKLAHLISTETGKPLWESLTEVNAAINKVDACITSINFRCQYPTIETETKTIETIIKPFGIVGVIGPFNFPLHIPHGQIIPSFLCGNSILVKPSEYTTKTSKLYEKIISECFKNEPNPIQFIYGEKEHGEYIVNHPNISFIFFTGSYKTGYLIEKTCLKLRKPVALEMGGNNPIIIEDIINEKKIIEHIISSSFITAGQRCSCSRRLIINKKHGHIIKKLLRKIKTLSIEKYPTQKKAFMGPVVLESTKNTLLTKSFKACETLLKSHDLGLGGLVSPRIELCNNQFKYDEEIFGPMLFIYVTDSFEESINRANQSNFGLTSSIYTSSKKKFLHAQKNIHSGVINWNNPTTGASGLAAFGGVKNSGNYKPGGFNMIDHCYIPISSTQSKKIEQIKLPGLNL